MKKPYLITAALVAFIAISGFSQVDFGIRYDKSTESFIVSLYPLETYTLPNNLTATAQITIKTPAGTFDPSDVKGLYPGIEWEYNSRADAPKEASKYDYLSFALINPGLLHLPLEEGKELPILSFKNSSGCNGTVALVDNATDPFMAPNSKNVNIGNTIAILGAGAEAYRGIKGPKEIDCATITSATDLADQVEDFDIYPVPAQRDLTLEVSWAGEKEAVRAEIRDVAGRLVTVKVIELIQGNNTYNFDVSNLAAGSYLLSLRGSEWNVTLDKFQKIKF
jgi:hypothetical protein